MTLFSEPADVSVRPAVLEDAPVIAAIQLAAWRATHSERLGEALSRLDEAALVPGWTQAVAQPPGPDHRVLVACAGDRVVGFAAVRPVGEGTGEVLALEVHPVERRSGHGSRLLAACVDLLRQDGARQLVTWVLDGDEARVRFLSGAGLGPDGRVRELDAGGEPVRERRWAAEI